MAACCWRSAAAPLRALRAAAASGRPFQLTTALVWHAPDDCLFGSVIACVVIASLTTTTASFQALRFIPGATPALVRCCRLALALTPSARTATRMRGSRHTLRLQSWPSPLTATRRLDGGCSHLPQPLLSLDHCALLLAYRPVSHRFSRSLCPLNGTAAFGLAAGLRLRAACAHQVAADMRTEATVPPGAAHLSYSLRCLPRTALCRSRSPTQPHATAQAQEHESGQGVLIPN
jgi:hypothetical protein